MSTMDSDHLLMAYADGNLDEAAVREVERRMAADPHVRARVALYCETASLLRSAYGEAQYASAATLLPSVRELPASSRRRIAMAFAASIVVGVLGFGAARMLPGAQEPDLLGEIAEYHTVISRETTHLAELPASRAEEAMAWLGARIARRLVVPDLASTSLHFAGARMLVFDGQPVADLLYVREHGLPVALCVVHMPGSVQPIRISRRGGLMLAMWRDGGYAYIVVGELDEWKARDIAERAAVQLRG